jgi:replication factor A1
MDIKDLQAKQGKVDLTAEVTEKSPPREFEKFGREGKVCDAKIKDDSGEIKLTLWNEQVDQVNIGDTIKITNGYVGDWQGEMQLSTGKFGQLEVTKKGSGAEPEKEAPKSAETEDEVLEEDVVDDETLGKPD